MGQIFLSAALSLGVTGFFVVYHGYLGLCYASMWHGSNGIFYLLLMVIWGTILLTEKRNQTWPASEQNRCLRRAFLISSLLLLGMDVALIWPIIYGMIVSITLRLLGKGVQQATSLSYCDSLKNTV
ncbi:hypothetical protein ACTQ4E_08165 [Lawsonibacter sp. LCP25S3_G6]|uniref:hypothetical protein n=1 Tax=unclassified Lawsonibacter TaxID=2617946 RepID=UPI003F94CF1B